MASKPDRFERVCRGVYSTLDRRFFLEDRGSGATKRWRLCEQGELVAYMPSVSLHLATLKSPLWHRTESARGAIAWAKYVIRSREESVMGDKRISVP